HAGGARRESPHRDPPDPAAGREAGRYTAADRGAGRDTGSRRATLSDDARSRLERIFRRALAAVDADVAVRRALVSERGALAIAGRALPPDARLAGLAAGQAAAPLARGGRGQ